MSEIEQTVAEL